MPPPPHMARLMADIPGARPQPLLPHALSPPPPPPPPPPPSAWPPAPPPPAGRVVGPAGGGGAGCCASVSFLPLPACPMLWLFTQKLPPAPPQAKDAPSDLNPPV